MAVIMLGLAGCRNTEVDVTTTNDTNESSIVASEEATSTTENAIGEMTIAERLQYLTIEGQEVGLPCRVGELNGKLRVGSGSTIILEDEGYTYINNVCDLIYDDIEIGHVYIDCPPIGDELVDMSSGYENKYIYQFEMWIAPIGIEDKMDFEILGITEESTKEDIYNIFGDPTYESEGNMSYYDVDVDTQQPPYEYNHIYFNFDADGTMDRVVFGVYSAKKEIFEEN